eukprot:280660_1
MTIEAWHMDDDTATDQRKPHRITPNNPASESDLREVGVSSWSLDADKYKDDPALNKVRTERGYTYEDVVTVSPALPKYQEMMRTFYEEHMHIDDEARYVLDGSGYFDVRDKQDKWIRIAVGKGGFLIVPSGIYHRFTVDESNYIKAMRLNVSEPQWTPYNRPQDSHPVREAYVKRLGK